MIGSIAKYYIDYDVQEFEVETHKSAIQTKVELLMCGYFRQFESRYLPQDLGSLIGIYSGIKHIVTCVLFSILTDETIVKFELYEYAAEFMYKNEIKLALKYSDMISKRNLKCNFYEKIIDRFGNDPQHNSVLFDCYTFCLSRFIDLKYCVGVFLLIEMFKLFLFLRKCAVNRLIATNEVNFVSLKLWKCICNCLITSC